MPRMGANLPSARQTLIALGLVLVVATAIFGSMSLLSPHRTVLVTTEAGSQATSCPTGYPGKPRHLARFGQRPLRRRPTSHASRAASG